MGQTERRTKLSELATFGRLFRWNSVEFHEVNTTLYSQVDLPFSIDKNMSCPWCKKRLKEDVREKFGITQNIWHCVYDCVFCGWNYSHEYFYSTLAHRVWQAKGEYLIAKRFNINDSNVLLSEIGTHLKRFYADVYNLSPRRFEELIGDVFKQKRFRTRLTHQTKDGGADIILLDNNDNNLAIVEVKRYAQTRSVGIEIVDRLIGAAVRWKVGSAYLVISSTFSQVATSETEKMKESRVGLELELWDADRLLRELGCYNEKMPPLDLIDP